MQNFIRAIRKIYGCMACDPKGAIGLEGNLPWNYPDELEHFRRTAEGHILIMGYSTFINTPLSTLEKSFNIIFTRQKRILPQNITGLFVNSLEEFLELKNLPADKKQFMIGGGQLAELFLKNNLIDEFLLTKIHKEFPGDAFFPLQLLEHWPHNILTSTADYTIYSYKNLV